MIKCKMEREVSDLIHTLHSLYKFRIIRNTDNVAGYFEWNW